MSSTRIEEKDKPFVLAIISSGITIMNIVIVAIGSFLGNKDMQTNGMELLKFTFPLTAMAWTYYLSKKE